MFAVLVTLASAVSAAGVNGRIAFSCDRSGVFAIWTINPNGTGATQLTHHGANIQDWWPVVSPDGRRIAFTRYLRTNKTPGSQALYIMNADGSGVQRLSSLRNGFDDNLADFSPDGSKIAFISDRDTDTTLCRVTAVGGFSCNWQIYLMNVDGTDQRRITNEPAADTYPEFSPDGTEILFDSTRSGASAVYKMNADGTNVQQLTEDSLGAGNSNWSPDGTKITFVWQFEANDNEIYTMNADGSDVTQLTNYGDRPTLEPEYSPDGKNIVFGLFPPISNSHQGCCGKADLILMNADDGSGKTDITNLSPAIDSETPDWGPAVP
jgi:Tol biopolymer transport system component